MVSRVMRFSLLTVAVCALAASAAAWALAAGDTDDSISPASTPIKMVLKPGTKATISSTVGTTTVTATCTASTTSGKTPATGLGPITLSNPTFSGCTDNFGGTDTVTTNSTNGKWRAVFLDAPNDEAKEVAGDRIRLVIPKAGATATSSKAPGCVVELAPSAPAAISGAYNDINATTFKNAPLPGSTSSSCPGGSMTGTGKFTATYVSSPGFHDNS
jgi:hypothetical protein